RQGTPTASPPPTGRRRGGIPMDRTPIRLYMSMSVDGYIAGPDDRPGQELGRDGGRLFNWLDDRMGAGINGQVYSEALATGAVIPIHDVNPLRRTPWITIGLVAANIIVFVSTPGVRQSLAGQVSLGDLCRLQAFVEHWGAVPRELIHNQLPALVPTGNAVLG